MAIHMGYRQTRAVYTRRTGSVQIRPDQPPISVRTRISSNSSTDQIWDADRPPMLIKMTQHHAASADINYLYSWTSSSLPK